MGCTFILSTIAIQTIIAGIVLIFVFFGFIYTFMFFKEMNRYIDEVNSHLINGTKEIYTHLKIKDKKYFPYYKTHGYGVMHKFGGVGTRCEVTGFSAKKNYMISPEKIMYIVNNQVNYPFNIVEIEGKKYFEITDEIKTMQVLFSFSAPAHLLFKIEFKKEDDGYSFVLEEEVIPGERNGNQTAGNNFKL